MMYLLKYTKHTSNNYNVYDDVTNCSTGTITFPEVLTTKPRGEPHTSLQQFLQQYGCIIIATSDSHPEYFI